MIIELSHISPDPDPILIRTLGNPTRPEEVLVVVRPDPLEAARWILVDGEEAIRVRRAGGATAVEATVLENPTPDRIAAVQIAAGFSRGTPEPVAFARVLLGFRRRFGISQQEAARRLGITPGTIHHYESLVVDLAPSLREALEAGKLTFKEARSLADVPDHERQVELAKPFLNGSLSSVYVEGIVGLAKQYQGMPAEKVIQSALEGNTKAQQRFQKKAAPSAVPVVDVERLERTLIDSAAHVAGLQLVTVPEYRRRSLCGTLLLLRRKIDGAVEYLSGEQPGILERLTAQPAKVA